MPATPSEETDVEPFAPSPAGEVRRLHPLTPFFDLILLGRQFALPIVLGLFANRDRGSLFFLVPTVLGTAVAFARWLRFSYVVDGGRFVISEGVLTRKQRVIPLDRIQHVSLQTRLRHRLFGVTVLRIDTAGGSGGPEVDLSVVSAVEAARLQRVLLELRLTVEPDPSPEPTEEADIPLIRMSVPRLMLAGVTGSELAVMVTIVGWLFQIVDDLPRSLLDIGPRDVDRPRTPQEYVLIGALLLMVWFGLAAAASVLRNGGYVLSRRDEDLHVTRGVFDRREASIPVHRLQSVRVQEAFVRRLLRLAAVRLRSTGGTIDVPLVSRDETASIVDTVLPGHVLGRLVPAPAAARRRAILRRVLPALGVGVAATAWSGRLAPLAGLGVFLAAILGELAYRGLGHAFTDGAVVAREGGLFRETVIVPSAKAQSTRLRSTPLQRRAGLSTLWVDVAGGGPMPVVRDGATDRLEALQQALLSDAARQDEAAVRRRRDAVDGADG